MKQSYRFAAVALACMSFCFSSTGYAQSQTAKIESDIVYGHKDGLAMTMDAYRPAKNGNGAAILFMVSGGWYSKWAPPAQTQQFFEPYLKRGYTVFAVRHGSSPRYSIPEAIEDVRLAVRYVHQHAERLGVDAHRLGVMGMSAGGHLALILGTTGDDGSPDAKDRRNRFPSRVQAVVALVPPTDLRVAVWESPESLPAYRNFPALDLPLAKAGPASPLTHVTKDDAPSLVIMGGKDELVPPKHGQWIAEAFQKNQIEHKLIVLENAGHGLQGKDNQAKVLEETLSWFDRHLAKKP